MRSAYPGTTFNINRTNEKKSYPGRRNGCIYDAWHDWFQQDVWKQAFEDHEVDIGFYTFRERSTEETLPY